MQVCEITVLSLTLQRGVGQRLPHEIPWTFRAISKLFDEFLKQFQAISRCFLAF